MKLYIKHTPNGKFIETVLDGTCVTYDVLLDIIGNGDFSIVSVFHNTEHTAVYVTACRL